jgi:hypothetical protein
MDKIDRAYIESYLVAKKRDGLSSKAVCNHLNFRHGLCLDEDPRTTESRGTPARPWVRGADTGARIV